MYNLEELHIIFEDNDVAVAPFSEIKSFYFSELTEDLSGPNHFSNESNCNEYSVKKFFESGSIKLFSSAARIQTKYSTIDFLTKLFEFRVKTLNFYGADKEEPDYSLEVEWLGAEQEVKSVTSGIDIQFKRKKKEINIKVKLITKTAKVPTKAYLTDAGFDIYSDGDFEINVGESVVIPTGFATAIPEGWYAAVHMRSGLRFKEGLTGLSEGVIDSSFRGEWKILVYKELDSGESLIIKKGDKIAQFVLHKVPNVKLVQTSLLNETERGGDGFGSTGR